MNFLLIQSHQHVALDDIPVMPFSLFLKKAQEQSLDASSYIESYYGFREGGIIRFFCSIAYHLKEELSLCSFLEFDEDGIQLESLCAVYPGALGFEQDITRYLGVHFAPMQRRENPAGSLVGGRSCLVPPSLQKQFFNPNLN